MNSARTIRLLFWLSLLLMPVQSAGHQDTQTRDAPTGELHTAVWRFSVWGREFTGDACWLMDAVGRWRIEFAVAEAIRETRDTLVSLLDQEGQGWTVVSTDGSAAYIQPWRDKLESIPAHEANMMGALLELAVSGSGSVAALRSNGATVSDAGQYRIRPRLPWHTGVETNGSMIVDWSGSYESNLKGTLEGRGRGRGGRGEIWRVDFTEPGVWKLRSSRRSGVLHVTSGHIWRAAYDPDEVFLPMWPLAELLQMKRLSGHGTGTRHAPPE